MGSFKELEILMGIIRNNTNNTNNNENNTNNKNNENISIIKKEIDVVSLSEDEINKLIYEDIIKGTNIFLNKNIRISKEKLFVDNREVDMNLAKETLENEIKKIKKYINVKRNLKKIENENNKLMDEIFGN